MTRTHIPKLSAAMENFLIGLGLSLVNAALGAFISYPDQNLITVGFASYAIVQLAKAARAYFQANPTPVQPPTQ